jgi:CheY-like chemotaxis protein
LQRLIDYTRLEFGRLRLEPVATDLRGLLQSLAGDRPEIAIHVDVAVPDALNFDPLRLRQVLTSLLDRAGPAGASVKVHRDSFGPEGVGLRFVVTGNGARVEPRGGGALLGQALINGLVKKMGGQLWEDENGIYLTLTVAAATVRPVTPELPPRQLQILLVDDSKVTQFLVNTVLKLRGHEVTVAGDGQVAVEMCGLADFDLILMDLDMPVMNGLEAARLLRAQGNITPIIALTGHERQDWTRRCLEAGMNGFLSKPVEEPDLLETIASVMSAEAYPAAPPGEPPVAPARFDDLTAALTEDWPDWLSALDQAFRSLDANQVSQVTREIEGWLAGLTAMPAARAAAQLALLAEEGRLEAALHQRRNLLMEVNRLRTSTSSLEVPQALEPRR